MSSPIPPLPPIVAFAGSSTKSSNRSPIQVLTAIYFAYLREKANHSTCVAVKVGFHRKAVEVVYRPTYIRYITIAFIFDIIFLKINRNTRPCQALLTEDQFTMSSMFQCLSK